MPSFHSTSILIIQVYLIYTTCLFDFPLASFGEAAFASLFGKYILQINTEFAIVKSANLWRGCS